MQQGDQVKDVTLSCGRMLTIDAPAAGVWKLRVAPTSRFWLVAEAKTDSFAYIAEFPTESRLPAPPPAVPDGRQRAR